jgi:hypothetical protein
VTPNDEQIGLLIRRFGGNTAGAPETAPHLDADEMNAFAEGALPPAARARYVSHLAECDQCRRQVSELALATGALVRTGQVTAAAPERPSWWAGLVGLFAVPRLRYAAFAAMLLVAAGISFIALRQRPASHDLLSSKREVDQSQPSTALKPAIEPNGGVSPDVNSGRESTSPAPAPAATQAAAGLMGKDLDAKPQEARSADANASETQPMKEPLRVVEGEKKAEETTTAQDKPAYAPPPPGQKEAAAAPQTQSGFGYSPGGPRQVQQQQAQSPVAKSMPADRERDTAKDVRLEDSNRKADQPELAGRRGNDEKLKGGPSRNNTDNMAVNNRAANEVRSETPKNAGGTASEDGAETTRSAGGHKFRRQGNSWVDQKYKSSMSLKNVERGSDEFAALDAGLRSIAQQFGGDVIVVWKGKAYQIK